jgi:hypothetical protein
MAEIDALQQLIDCENIRTCLARYCRGVDRADADLVRSAYWPDVDANQLDFRGDCEAFIAWCFPSVAKMDFMSHQIGNVLIELDGDSADVQAQFTSYRRVAAEGGLKGYLGGGRYLDRFARRDGVWKIAKRLVVVDWSHELGMAPPGLPLSGAVKRWPEDISYSWFQESSP